jgi:hypothetical protein
MSKSINKKNVGILSPLPINCSFITINSKGVISTKPIRSIKKKKNLPVLRIN